MVQLNPVPVFGAKKNTSTISRKFFVEISIQVVSAQAIATGKKLLFCVYVNFRKVKLPWGNFSRAIYHSVTPNMKVINNQS